MLTATPQDVLEDIDYEALSRQIRSRFERLVSPGTPLFTTKAAGLYDIYLDNLDSEIRQIHNCNTCRSFVDRYGSLVVIDEHGKVQSVLWDEADAPAVYRDAVSALRSLVEHSPIDGVFYTSERHWGTAVTGDWNHLHVVPPQQLVHRDRAQTARQKMAEKAEDYRMLVAALAFYTQAHLEDAVTLLKGNALYRSEKVLGVAEWLLNLYRARATAPSRPQRDAGTWLSVVTAPAGFCHVRSSMIGTLLDDIRNGLPGSEVQRRFAEKMNPLQYQRPQAAPKTGAINAAEKLVEKLGIARSLERRYARLDELTTIWRPSLKVEQPSAGVFGHLKAAQPADTEIAGSAMTWEKFSRLVLPQATEIEVIAPRSGNYIAFLTAVHADAPPILQWDREDARNPVSHYVYAGGSSAPRWNLRGGAYTKCLAIVRNPHEWCGSPLPNHALGVSFILDGAFDTHGSNLCLFPETLKADLHAARSTIEAHSRATRLQPDPTSAAGLRLSVGNEVKLRVRVGGTLTTYTIDRID
jgi:hypothetical protein